MFEFEFDEELFKFEQNKPSFEPLPDLPLTFKTALFTDRLVT